MNPQAQPENLASAFETTPVVLQVGDAFELTANEFFDLCAANRDLRIERSAEGDILIMPPTGARTGVRGVELLLQLRLWSGQDGSGVVFDSSTGFNLPNRATRSPDVSWVKRSRLDGLTSAQKEKFLPLCPDFVIELRSPSDRLAVLQAKMEEYVTNGSQLAWLIDPNDRCIYVYRPATAPACLRDVSTLSAEPVLPGFVLSLHPIWEPVI